MSKKRAEALFKREKERQAREAEEKQRAYDADATRRQEAAKRNLQKKIFKDKEVVATPID